MPGAEPRPCCITGMPERTQRSVEVLDLGVETAEPRLADAAPDVIGDLDDRGDDRGNPDLLVHAGRRLGGVGRRTPDGAARAMLGVAHAAAGGAGRRAAPS